MRFTKQKSTQQNYMYMYEDGPPSLVWLPRGSRSLTEAEQQFAFPRAGIESYHIAACGRHLTALYDATSRVCSRVLSQ